MVLTASVLLMVVLQVMTWDRGDGAADGGAAEGAAGGRDMGR